MLYNDDKEIVEYLLSKYPEEGCGIIQNIKGKLRWIPSTNVAENPEEYFKINEEDYLRATLTGDIHAIVHSHPNASAELSEADKKASDHLGVPYIVYSIPEGEKVEYIPERKTLIGRDYVFGENDCYTLARDYYKQELNLDLPVQDFEDDWWDLGLNYFDDLFEKFGFREVQDPKIGDGILFKVYCNVPNHCGIYLGEDVFLHHAINRISCRENLYPFWAKHVSRYVRYAKS